MAVSPSPISYSSSTNAVGTLPTTPKLPKRERLASFSRLLTSENFTEIMPDKVSARERRTSCEINWKSEVLPQIRVFPESPQKVIPKKLSPALTSNYNNTLYPGMQPLPFSPNLLNQSPNYISPNYRRPTPLKSPLYISERKGVFLGRGSFGNVSLCTYRGKKFALKVTCDRASGNGERNFINIRHPHLVRILHTTTVLDKIFICMEFAGHCNLQQVLDTKSELDFPRRLSFTIQIALGLRHCHQRSIVHGDVKPANVIVSPYGICKLGDFGHSIKLNGVLNDRSLHNEDIVGTAAYAAPEVLRGAHPNLPSDIYSFGILLWQVQTRELPYAGEHPHVIIYKVANYGLRPCFGKVEYQYLKSYEKITEICWMDDPFERLTIFDVLQKLREIEKEIKNGHYTKIT